MKQMYTDGAKTDVNPKPVKESKWAKRFNSPAKIAGWVIIAVIVVIIIAIWRGKTYDHKSGSVSARVIETLPDTPGKHTIVVGKEFSQPVVVFPGKRVDWFFDEDVVVLQKITYVDGSVTREKIIEFDNRVELNGPKLRSSAWATKNGTATIHYQVVDDIQSAKTKKAKS